MHLAATAILAVPLLALAACSSAETRRAETRNPETQRAVTTERLEPYSCGEIKNLHTLDGVFLASQPTAADFEQAMLSGVKTVINLRHERELGDFDEEAAVTALGLDYISLPFNGPDELTDDVFAHARALLRTAQRPILLHCGSANRVGALWLPWRVLDGGLSLEEAQQEARTVGLKTQAYEDKAIDYVRRNL